MNTPKNETPFSVIGRAAGTGMVAISAALAYGISQMDDPASIPVQTAKEPELPASQEALDFCQALMKTPDREDSIYDLGEEQNRIKVLVERAVEYDLDDHPKNTHVTVRCGAKKLLRFPGEGDEAFPIAEYLGIFQKQLIEAVPELLSIRAREFQRGTPDGEFREYRDEPSPDGRPDALEKGKAYTNGSRTAFSHTEPAMFQRIHLPDFHARMSDAHKRMQRGDFERKAGKARNK